MHFCLLLLLLCYFTTSCIEIPECQSCIDSQEMLRSYGENTAIDALAMATLSQLSYISWERKTQGDGWWYDVKGLLRPPRSRLDKIRRSVLRIKETGRWLRCAWNMWKEYPHPPGSRLPRHISSSDRKLSACTPFLLQRRWWLAWWLYDWHEVSGPLRWHNTQVLISIRASDGALSFSFRGSTDARHLATNLQPLTRDVCPTNQSSQLPGKTVHGIRRSFARVHKGHTLSLLPPNLQLENTLVSILNILQLNISARNNFLADTLTFCARAALDAGKHVFVTGHSLGAAHALLLAARISPPPGPAPKRLHVYSFGEPSFGDSVFYSAYTHLNPRVYRFVGVGTPPHCATDVVTRIATFAGAATQHLASPIFLCDVWYSLRGPISAHAMDNYYRSLVHSTSHWLILQLSPSSSLMEPDIGLLYNHSQFHFLSSVRDGDTSLGPPVSVLNLSKNFGVVETTMKETLTEKNEVAISNKEHDYPYDHRRNTRDRRRRPGFNLPRAIRTRWF